MDVFVALVAVAVGLVVCFFGYRIFRLLLPFLGFFVGLIVGAQVVASIFGEGFLATIIGIVAGLVVGLLFGALAYLWWWLGVILAFGGMGYALGAAILPAIGIENSGIFNFVLGLASAAVFAIIAIVLRMPKLIVIAVTGLWGSGAIIASWLILTNQLEPDQLGFGAVDAVVGESFFWLLVFFGVAVVGMAFQLATTREYVVMWDEEYPWEGPASPTTPSAPSTS